MNCFLDEDNDVPYVIEDVVEELRVKVEKELMTVKLATEQLAS